MTKTRVAIIFGGTNTEHEVSLVSARAVIDNLDPKKYEVVPIKITKENTWITQKQITPSYQPTISSGIVSAEKSIDTLDDIFEDSTFDVVFPVLHGPYGEDGTIQGLLELMRLPYVGCGVTASAVCMDKVIQKNICESYNIPVTPYFSLTAGQWSNDLDRVLSNLKKKFKNQFPLFVKPANQGSSVGITKAHNHAELIQGIDLAFTRDLKILVEQGVSNAREIECAVLGTNDNPVSSVLGEIIPSNEFYDYEAKYLDEKSRSIIPADLPPELADEIKRTACLAFQALDCYGLARIDFLLDAKTGSFYLNELNTMPGFTPISMYPKLWEASGLSYSKLLDQLIEPAITRHQAKSNINLSR